MRGAGAGVAGLAGLSGIATAQVDEVNFLIVSVTQGYRHQSIEAGNEAIRNMADRFAAETGADEVNVDVIDGQGPNAFTDPKPVAYEFPTSYEELEPYDAVIWNNTTHQVLAPGGPADLEPDQRQAFEEYIRNGGGYVGVHAAADTHYDWEWYGELVGAWFENHPSVQEAVLTVEDRTHPSTEHLPSEWVHTDEWYDWHANPRGDVNVLVTIDEDSYDGAGMEGGRVDHPMSWCQRFQGGRSWYTNLGHREETFSNDAFLDHLFWGIMWSAGFVDDDATANVWDSYRRTEVTAAVDDPSSMTIAPDGRIFAVGRGRDVAVVDPDAGSATTALEREFWSEHDGGGLGIALDPAFEENGWLYLYYSPTDADLDADADTPYNQLSRFTVENGTIDPASEVEILRVPQQREAFGHASGELEFGPEGDLYVATGDNIEPDDDGYAPLDERTAPNTSDARGTAGDTSDLRGSVLRITPEDDGSYSIPAGNMFTSEGHAQARERGQVAPEIYAMGFRKPVGLDVDETTGSVYLSDQGPSAQDWNENRGPIGISEYVQIPEGGYMGAWPYARGPGYPYLRYDYESGESGELFDPENLTNDSPNNDGFEQLPGIDPTTYYVPTDWQAYTAYGNPGPSEQLEQDSEEHWNPPDQPTFPEFQNAATHGGTVVRLPDDTAETALPSYFDGKWLVADETGTLRVVTFTDDGTPLEVAPFLSDGTLAEGTLRDVEVGPEGRLYYLDATGDGTTIKQLEFNTADVTLQGQFSGWVGKYPEGIEGQTNPTLSFQEGELVEVEWVGGGHNFVVIDSNGNPFFTTDVLGYGDKGTVEFVAKTEMAEYICQPHRNIMRGTVEVTEPVDGVGSIPYFTEY